MSTALGSFDHHIKESLAYKYQIQSLIGRGGMANVYKAIQKGLDREVAIKVVHPSLIHDEESVKRFRLEAKSSAKLNHYNIVTIYDVDEVGDLLFITLELLEGQDLSRLIRKKSGISVDKMVKYMIELSDALHYIHSKGMIHRDIKSSNIFVTDNDKPVLMDFGIASLKENSSGITNVGTVIGTPEFMSPEQANGQRLDGRSDIYSLGVVMYECLAGKVPFSGDSAISTIIKINTTEPAPLENLPISIPDWLKAVVYKCIHRNPDQRFNNAMELKQSLKQEKVIRVDQVSEAKTKRVAVDEEAEKLKELIKEYHQTKDLNGQIKLLSSLSAEQLQRINGHKQLMLVEGFESELLSKLQMVEELFERIKSFKDLEDLYKNLMSSEDSLSEVDKVLDIVLMLPQTKIVGQEIKSLEICMSSYKILDYYRKEKKYVRYFSATLSLLKLKDELKTNTDLGKHLVKLVDNQLKKELSLFTDQVLDGFKNKSFSTENISIINDAQQILYILNNTKSQDSLLTKWRGEIIKSLSVFNKSFLVEPLSKSGEGLRDNVKIKPPHGLSTAAGKGRTEPQGVTFNFDEEYYKFINHSVGDSYQSRNLLGTDNRKLNQQGVSRLLYLFFSARLENNGFDLIHRNHYPLLSKVQMLMNQARVPAANLTFLVDGEGVKFADINVERDLNNPEGKSLWDQELRVFLAKLKSQEPMDSSVSQKRVILQKNFNDILELLKNCVLATVIVALKN